MMETEGLKKRVYLRFFDERELLKISRAKPTPIRTKKVTQLLKISIKLICPPFSSKFY